jgi:hypothetical protein
VQQLPPFRVPISWGEVAAGEQPPCRRDPDHEDGQQDRQGAQGDGAADQGVRRGVVVEGAEEAEEGNGRPGLGDEVDGKADRAGIGESMQPFSRDEQVLANQVRRIAGVDRTSVLYFANCPVRGAGPGPRWTWRTYSPPKSGTRVLVVSDFGIGGPVLYLERSEEEEWRAFVMTVRRAGCTLIGVVPYPPRRWPHWLTNLLPSVTWDRSTTVARVSVARAGR